MALPPPVTEVPLREAVERYLEACRAKARAQSMAPATVKNYTWDLERFLDLLPGTVLHTTESVTGEEIDITPAARRMLEDIGHPFAGGDPVYDVTFENVQAGLRTDYLFRLANQRHGFTSEL